MPAAELPTRAHATASRAQLFDLLAEAAELEHNLLCCYLYAAFSLQTVRGHGLAGDELEAVRRWYDAILGVAMEEMTHLALIATSASRSASGRTSTGRTCLQHRCISRPRSS